MNERKKDHIDLAFQSQLKELHNDKRFFYEPAMGNFKDNFIPEFSLANKKMKFPIWISSMTGGTEKAKNINKNLATIAGEYGLGMGLGSCRIILEHPEYFSDFDIRRYMGNDLPLFANLGVIQIQEMLEKNKIQSINQLIDDLQADGIIIHINPLQEWIQPEGDFMAISPIETIREFLGLVNKPVIVKEVGQGFGIESLTSLLELPLEALDTAAFGGTNFSKVEIWRREQNDREMFEPLSNIGHTNDEILAYIKKIKSEGYPILTKKVIFSGGIHSFLDGYYFMQSSPISAIYGQASGFLKYALQGIDALRHYTEIQTKGIQLAYNFLKIRENAF